MIINNKFWCQILNFANTQPKFTARIMLFLILVLPLIFISYYVFIKPGLLFIEFWILDLFAFFDASYRTANGQIPTVDFHTATGPLNYLFPALAINMNIPYELVPAVSSLPIFIFQTILLYFISKNKGLNVSTISCLIVFLWLLICIPGIVDNWDATYAVYYNRQSWAALTLLFLFYLPDHSTSKSTLYSNAIVMACLCAYLIYTKITFGIIALGFLAASMIFSRRHFISGCLALIAIVIIGLLVELMLGLHGPYINNVRDIMQVRLSPIQASELLWLITKNIYAYAVAVLIYLYFVIFFRFKLLDALIVAGIIMTCLILSSQNADKFAAPALLAIPFILCQLGANQFKTSDDQALKAAYPGLLVLLVIMITPIAFSRGIITMKTLAANGTQPTIGTPARFGAYRVPEIEHVSWQTFADDYDADSEILQALRLNFGNSVAMENLEVLIAIDNGLKLIQENKPDVSSVFVTEIANPFGYLLNLTPNQNGKPFLWNFAADVASFSPENTIQDSEVILMPVFPYNSRYKDKFLKEYGDYIQEHYQLADSSDYWKLWIKK